MDVNIRNYKMKISLNILYVHNSYGINNINMFRLFDAIDMLSVRVYV